MLSQIDMSCMFYDCGELLSIDLSSFETYKVEKKLSNIEKDF